MHQEILAFEWLDLEGWYCGARTERNFNRHLDEIDKDPNPTRRGKLREFAWEWFILDYLEDQADAIQERGSLVFFGRFRWKLPFIRRHPEREAPDRLPNLS